MKNKYIFITYLEHYGGIETLVFRMINWLKEHDYSVDLIVDKDRVEDENMINIARKSCANIYSFPFRRGISKKELKTINMEMDENVKIICFTYPEFFLAHQIKKYFHKKYIDIIFYVPHQYGLIMEFNFNNAIWKKIGHVLGKHFIKRANNNNEIIHMDYLCLDRLKTEYGIKSNPKSVIPLATEILPVDNEHINKVFGKDDTVILSIARAMFPFKGYLFGLMDLFDDLCDKYEHLELRIIGDGPDFQKLKEYKATRKHKEKIDLLGQVPYSDLPLHFDDAKIYIGMGTTVLDAANHSVLCFPIGSYTYECKGYDYYYKDGMNLGGMYGKCDISRLLEEVISMDELTYLNIINKQNNEINRCYEINSIMHRIEKFNNIDKKSGMGWLDLMLVRVIKCLYTIKEVIK